MSEPKYLKQWVDWQNIETLETCGERLIGINHYAKTRLAGCIDPDKDWEFELESEKDERGGHTTFFIRQHGGVLQAGVVRYTTQKDSGEYGHL
tara:strand:+ start:167 stop:445 length:279 start_codon:yes stop_codon:yes gene_type:complete